MPRAPFAIGPRTAASSVAMALALALALLIMACGGTPLSPSPPTPGQAADEGTLVVAAEEVLVGAGDIADCGEGAAATAALLDRISGTVFSAGDNAYPNGTADDYRRCYEPTWGRHKARTRPSPGNHDYDTPGATAYYTYFGALAGTSGLGFYSFDAGGWLVVSLNSSANVGPGSTQVAWLRSTLAQRRSRCILAIWHHPFVSSGPHGDTPQMREVWSVLEEYNADVAVGGHDHIYERFAPVDENGVPSPRGIRSFVAGTGGAPLNAVGAVRPGSEAHASVWGVLRFTLRPGSYDWAFIPAAGGTFHDEGSGTCR